MVTIICTIHFVERNAILYNMLVRPGGQSHRITRARSVVPNHKHAQKFGLLAGFLAISSECSCFLTCLVT